MSSAQQVRVQLPVRKPWREEVRGMYRERGLPKSACARHARDTDGRWSIPAVVARQQRAQLLHLAVPAGEVGDVRRELRRDRLSVRMPSKGDLHRVCGERPARWLDELRTSRLGQFEHLCQEL